MQYSRVGLVKRKIVRIDESKCDGCGQCVPSCAEGAIQVVDGKAVLLSDRLCDGLGACLGECPQGAISIEERESEPFDEAVVARHHPQPRAHPAHHSGCPSARLLDFSTRARVSEGSAAVGPSAPGALSHWPVQLHLLPPTAPFLRGADLLVCAPCVPFAMPDFHASLLKGRAVAIACPKLDDQTGYLEKLATMLADARPRSVTVARMTVPCCGGLLRLVHEARDVAESTVPITDCVIGHDGVVVEKNIDKLGPGRAKIRNAS
jgi:NAD-dependent dihydropyrimidine dehydrogenase PreA subunit